MTGGRSARREAIFPLVLAECITLEGITSLGLAQRLFVAGFPASDVATLHQAIVRLLGLSSPSDAWPLPVVDFIRAAAVHLPKVFQVEWRLTVAAALDALRARDP